MRKPFGRIGSKTYIAKYIISHFPNDYENMNYIEPFCGSGAIYWAKKPTTKERIEVLNDIDSNLIHAFENIKIINISDIPEDYKQIYKKYEESDDLLTNFYKSLDINTDKPLDIFVKNIVQYNFTYCSIGVRKAYSTKILINNKKQGSISGKVPLIPKYQERMKNTVFTTFDYKDIIVKYDSPNALFYLDPPYEKSNKHKLYSTINKEFDFNELYNILKNIKGKFILSINDSELIRNIFSECPRFNIIPFVVKAHSNNKHIGGKDRNELLIKNF